MRKYETVEIRIDNEVIATGNSGTIIEPVWFLIDIYNGPEEYKRTGQMFSEPQRLIHALRWYIAEVNNGGHKQFFNNSTGIVWRNAAKSFAAIGVKKGASIIFDAADRLGGSPSLDRATRQAELGQCKPDFSDLDNRFGDLYKATKLEAAMVDYVKANASEFFFSGKITRIVLPPMPARPRPNM